MTQWSSQAVSLESSFAVWCRQTVWIGLCWGRHTIVDSLRWQEAWECYSDSSPRVLFLFLQKSYNTGTKRYRRNMLPGIVLVWTRVSWSRDKASFQWRIMCTALANCLPPTWIWTVIRFVYAPDCVLSPATSYTYVRKSFSPLCIPAACALVYMDLYESFPQENSSMACARLNRRSEGELFEP